MDWNEINRLVSSGVWKNEGPAFYSAPAATGKPLYRVCKPNTDLHAHHYTDSMTECNLLKSAGWNIDGIAWYGLK